jgi:hypothetical protein
MTIVIQTEPCSELYGAVPSLALPEGSYTQTRRVIRRKNMLTTSELDAAKAALGAAPPP